MVGVNDIYPLNLKAVVNHWIYNHHRITFSVITRKCLGAPLKLPRSDGVQIRRNSIFSSEFIKYPNKTSWRTCMKSEYFIIIIYDFNFESLKPLAGDSSELLFFFHFWKVSV